MFYVCVVSFNTRLDCCLHLDLVVWLFVCYFLLFRSNQKLHQTKKPDTAKKTKPKNAENNPTTTNVFQLAQVCSQIVFLMFWVGLKMQRCAENTIKIVVSAKFETNRNDQKLSMFKPKLVQA